MRSEVVEGLNGASGQGFMLLEVLSRLLQS